MAALYLVEQRATIRKKGDTLVLMKNDGDLLVIYRKRIIPRKGIGILLLVSL